ncbi:MAG: energy transducer TonB [Gammaproteobacteria bacterium]|nr:energy transducer TonB [Gammaproteobacteria bacterium]MDH5630686.1 energy transducer TonB [Gammaproteobacteria bacterium]
MQNYQGIIDTTKQPVITASDKLLFSAVLGTAFHGMVLFGIGFALPEDNADSSSKVFNVVLAQYKTDEKPEKADFIGQADQQGGGDSDTTVAPSATEMAQLNDPDRVAQEAQSRMSQEQQVTPQQDVLTANSVTLASPKIDEQFPQEKQTPDAASLIDQTYQLTGLIANLDNKNNNQSKKDRLRTISPSIHRSSDALYLDTWRRKIERVGNQNYPQQAKLEEIYGSLTLKVAINKDGTINNVSIIKSSGIKMLDDAALRIVRLSAPFQPLTKEMSLDTDILEIVRTWNFMPDDSLNMN